MTLKEYLISHPKEIEKAITMMVEKETHVFSGEPLTDEEKDGFRQNLEFFAQNLLNLDPNMDENESIILFMPIRDNVMDEEEYIASSIYRKKDLDEYPGLTGIPEDPDSLSDEEVKQWMDKIKEHPYITSYGYEFSPWEDWLGLDIDLVSMERCGVTESLVDLFREMTFNGTTKESQDERREELDQSAAEFDEIMKLPEEEREERLIPWETIKEEIGFEDTRTDEEKQTDLMRMYRDSLWNVARREECIRIYKENRKNR